MVSSPVVEVDNLGPVRNNVLGGQLLVHREAMTSRSLPSCSSNPATSDFEKTSSWWFGHLITAEQDYQRCYVIWLEGLNHLFRHDRSSHSGASIGCDCVNIDVIFRTFAGEGTGETKDAAFLGLY
jgi:hypothetical protein